MNIPFTSEQFLGAFGKYNSAIWPAELIGYIVVLFAIIVLFTKFHWRSRFMSAVLGILWIWTGIVFHFLYFGKFNPAAPFFGGLFVLNGLIFIFAGTVKDELRFRLDGRWIRIVGYIFMAYAIIIYYLLGIALGDSYPRIPMFPVTPCPLTIFTFGLLLLSEKPVRWYVWLIPLIWSIIGFTAAVRFGIRQDFGLLAAGILGVILIRLSGGGRPSEPQIRLPVSRK